MFSSRSLLMPPSADNNSSFSSANIDNIQRYFRIKKNINIKLIIIIIII